MAWMPRIPPFGVGVPKKSAFFRIHASSFLFNAARPSLVIESKASTRAAGVVGAAEGLGATLSFSGSTANQWKPVATCHASSAVVRDFAWGRHSQLDPGTAARTRRVHAAWADSVSCASFTLVNNG